MATTMRKVKGLVAAFIALCFALTALPVAAHAAEATGTKQVTITDLQAGDTVEIYQVVEYTYNDGKDTYSRDFVAGLGDALNGVTINQFDAMADDSDAVKDVAEDMAAWARNNATPVETVDSVTGTSAVVDLGVGEYLVLVTPGSTNKTAVYQNALIKVEPTKASGEWELVATPETLPMKQSEIYVEKGVADGQGQLQPSTDNYSVGDEVEFTIETVIPVYDENVTTKTFTISDTMEHLTLVGAPTVKVGSATLVAGEHYTYTPNGKSFSINFTNHYAAIEQYAGQTLTVTYKATIDATAAHDIPGTNDVTLNFTNGENVVTVEDHVDVYTYQLRVVKTDENDNTPLQDAVFGVYTDAACTDQSNIGEITTGADGIASIDGLEAGTYYLKEITAPEGYQLDESVISVEVNQNTDGEGTLIRVVSQPITNTKTPALPVTGGAGTIAITAAGVVLVAGAATMIVRARKSNN